MVAAGHWRVSFALARGTFLTSHVAQCPDVAPECAVTTIPPHEHHARMELTHTELEADYGLREKLQLELRLPYDVKAQRVRYTTLTGAPLLPPYGDIHHRTETLRGISDPSLSLGWAPAAGWIVGLGTTLPAGHTVPNPIVLGREGKTHEHIQFGSGTFEPLLTAQWTRGRFVVAGEAKLSLYENSHGFRAPSTFVWTAGPSFRLGSVSIDPRLNGQLQTLGRWSGEVDEGSGFRSGGVRLQLSAPLRGFVIAPAVYRELWSRGVNRAADETFRQGTTVSLSLVRTF